ncbi:NmrA family NAD(P)-binding protein [Pseudarthrobacter sp. S9]|uniref:NmrA family NAD(P)-binding protein n=1 Tax=Pseudarthrobacter sp. S9 TaxID=3418421 RepID=UPI003D08058E
MSSQTTPTIFIIGGTGAQGMPIVQGLVADKKYKVRVLTRDATSPRAQALLALGNVSILEGSFADEEMCCGKDSAAATGPTSTSTGSIPVRKRRCTGPSAVMR